MNLTIAAVGRLKAGPLLDLQHEYLKRIRWALALREVEEKRKLSAAELKEREAALLLAEMPKGAVVVALDERGRTTSSEDFATLLGHWQDGGAAVAFLIGGA